MKVLTPSQRFTTYVMKGPKEAIITAMAFSCLSFLSWVSVVVICLVSLRQGMKQGFRILIWAVLPVLAIGVYQHDINMIWETIGYSFLLSWCMAGVLRYCSRWDWVIAFGVLVAVCGLASLLLLHPDYPDTVLPRLNQLYHAVYEQELTNVPLEKASAFLSGLATVLPGIQAIFIVFSALLNVLISRALQASLYQPGGLKKEVLNLKVPKIFGLIIALCGLGVWAGYPLAVYVMVVCLLPFLLSGLSFIHWFVEKIEKGRLLLLIVIYFLLCLFLPISLIPLVIVSLLDLVFDFRKEKGEYV
jgi:hypothetical protein